MLSLTYEMTIDKNAGGHDSQNSWILCSKRRCVRSTAAAAAAAAPAAAAAAAAAAATAAAVTAAATAAAAAAASIRTHQHYAYLITWPMHFSKFVDTFNIYDTEPINSELQLKTF